MSGQSVKLRRRSLALIGFAIVALATAAGAYVYRQVLEREQMALDSALDAHAAQLHQHLEARVAIVNAVAAAFEPERLSGRALETVDSRIIDDLPDLFSLVWVAALTAAEASEALAALRAAGHPDPAVLGPGRVAVPLEDVPDTLAMVLDIRPRTPLNERSLGVNTSMMPEPRAAQARARATRRAAATGPLELVQLPDEIAVIIYSPVYRADGQADLAPLGYVGMSFRFHALIAAAFSENPTPAFSFAVHDAGDPNRRILFDAGAEAGAPLQRSTDFAGRTLVVSYSPFQSPEAAARSAALVAVCFTFALGGLIMAGALVLSTAHRQTEFALTRQTEVEARLRVVVDELNHRVRNMLTIVQALIRFSFRDNAGEAARRMLMERLSALGHATTLLADGDWSGVSLSELVRTSALSASSGVKAEGPDLRLTPAAAQNIGLLIHELWTNATKHGALSAAGGQVRLVWEQQGDRFVLHWEEQGGPPAEAPAGVGFGRQLIETITPAAVHGKATLSFEGEGFRYRLEAPLASVAQEARRA